jgi:hypothetical protein
MSISDAKSAVGYLKVTWLAQASPPVLQASKEKPGRSRVFRFAKPGPKAGSIT